MLRSLYITMIYVSFLVFGAAAPFMFSLGYVWVDTFYPQAVVYEILNQLPVSLIMAVAAVGGYAILDRRKGRLTATSCLLMGFAVWVTLSTALWAEVPTAAWDKWNYAFKTICVGAFLPFVFRSRIQIEAFLQIYLFSVAVHFLPVGIKTMISGGGYGRQLGIVGGNSLLAEGSTLATVALMLVPIILYLRRNTRIMPRTLLADLLYLGLAVAAVAAAIGTYERTALIGLVVVGAGLWLSSRRKLLFGAIGLLAALAISLLTSSAWNERISTVSDYNTEGSALGRILVWRWTLNYVASHPLGGGFNAYIIDRIQFPPDPGGHVLVVHGKAFHSIYFEVLGEQGWVGVALFATVVGFAFYQLGAVARRTRRVPEMAWARELAFALQVSLLTLLTCGAFIGIGFQPMLYYLIGISACLREHVRQVERRGEAREAAVAIRAVPRPHPAARQRRAESAR